MNRTQRKSRKANKAVEDNIDIDGLVQDVTSSESSGVESDSEALIGHISSSSESIGVEPASEPLLRRNSSGSSYTQGTNRLPSCNRSDSIYSLTADWERAAKSKQEEKTEETASIKKPPVEKAVESEDEENAKAAVIAKLMGKFNELNMMHHQVMDAQDNNDNMIQDVQNTTDRMMNLMEGSSVTEPLHIFLKRKTKYNMI